MAEQIINELEKAAQVILAPTNFISNEERQRAEQVFLNFRKTKSPYQLCQQILETNTNDYILFETTGLIKLALLHEWTTLSKEDISSLRQYLFHYIINKPYLPQYVKTSIVHIIAIMIKKEAINDYGQERQNLLNEIENLITIGDLPNKILGCDLIFALINEYATSDKTSDIGVTLEVHLKERNKFQDHDLKRIFKFFVHVLDELMKKDIQEDTVNLLKHILPILESIFRWIHIGSGDNALDMFGLSLSSDTETNLVLPLVRDNPQLAHHMRCCLLQLANVNNSMMSQEIKLQYFTNYLQRFLKLITSINIIDEEANAIATIIKTQFTYNRGMLKLLPEDMFKLFMEQLVRITCMFIENTLKEESSCTNECLFNEALNILFEAWIYVLSEKSPFPREFCIQSSGQILSMYLQCHLFAPEGKRNTEQKNFDNEEFGIEEDDKTKYKEQLQTVGIFGRQVLSHSLPLLAQLIEARTSKLQEYLNTIAEQAELLNTMNIMNRLYEDIHWLLLIAGHILCMESIGEVATAPNEIMKYSIEQEEQGKTDMQNTFQFLASSETISSRVNVPIESVDHVVRLTADVFRLCTIEKTAISIRIDSILSPELSSTIMWFLRRWSLNYLTIEANQSEMSMTFVEVFGENSSRALWITNFLLENIEYNINAFKSEPVLMEETVQLLLSLVPSTKQLMYKSERFKSIIDLAVKGRYDLPHTVRRGLMQVVTDVGFRREEPNYWLQTLQPLQDRCKRLIYNEKFLQFYQREDIRIEIIDILECFIGVVRGIWYEKIESIISYLLVILQELPNLLSLYHNYQEIVILILELLSEFVQGMYNKNTLPQIYRIYVDTIQTYERWNINRLTIDATTGEYTYEDILALIQLLTNMALTLVTDDVSDASLCGLSILIPMITMDLLKFPTLCLRYFEMVECLCHAIPEKILKMKPELLQQLLVSVESGLTSFGYDACRLCCSIIQILVRHIIDCVSRDFPRNDIMAPFLNSLMTITLSRQIDTNYSLSNISECFYYLICCYQERYEQLVQNILSSQSDQEVVQRLVDAFTKLSQDIDFNNERNYILDFYDRFQVFAFNVWGFLVVK
ncbi:exportin-4 isoform X2 [Calliopsis andreniformis]|uniref:exportin-4 isoform X2 n=1 Tax=Calliopsis andreniformis TaxID=337506 RepID=UPI003FCE5065